MPTSRVEHVVGKHAVRAIQSATDVGAYTATTAAALYLATAGFLEEANALLGRLWSYRWPHSGDVWLADRAFEVLWSAAGQRPPDAPFAPEAVDRIEREHRVYVAMDRWAIPQPTQPWQHLEGLALLRRSMLLACPPTDRSPLPTAAPELEAVHGLDKYIAAFDEPNGWTFALATCLAAELAARNGLSNQAAHFAQQWAARYPEFWPNYSFECMASNRHVAPLLLQGILAEPLGLTAVSCRRYLDDLLAVVDARMRRGRSLVYGRWSWERLLAAISKQAIKAEPELYTQEERRARWIGRAPASEQAVSGAQTRLGIHLPDDYLGFVRASNGCAPTAATAPRLLLIEEIDRLRNVADPELFAIYKGYPGDDMASVMERCILVSDPEAEEMVLLIPPVQAPEPWQTWFFAHWVPGETRYPSFRHYMEQELQELRAQTDA